MGMELMRPVNLLMVCVAFGFVAAVVVGALP